MFVAVLGDEGLDPVFPVGLVQDRINQLYQDYPKKNGLTKEQLERVKRERTMRGDDAMIGFGGTVAIVDDRIPTYRNLKQNYKKIIVTIKNDFY